MNLPWSLSHERQYFIIWAKSSYNSSNMLLCTLNFGWTMTLIWRNFLVSWQMCASKQSSMGINKNKCIFFYWPKCWNIYRLFFLIHCCKILHGVYEWGWENSKFYLGFVTYLMMFKYKMLLELVFSFVKIFTLLKMFLKKKLSQDSELGSSHFYLWL